MSRLLTILWSHFVVPLAFFFCVVLPCEQSAAQQRVIDPARLFDGIELRPSNSAFIAPPREVIRPLLRCKKLMAVGKIGEAVEILGEILADDAGEDYLIPRGSRSFGSLRLRTESILGSIDAKYLEPYQVRYDIRARKLLERGVAENDLSLLKKVSNQFFFTDSGAEAAMLLGHTELSNGQPSAAQSWFAKIVRFPATAAKHDPEASIMLATCQLLGNNQVAAKETLVSLKSRMPDSSIEFMGRNYTLFSRDEDAFSWLTKLIGDAPIGSNRIVNRLLMFQGTPARTGTTGTGMPLLSARWEHRIAESASLQESASGYLETLIQDSAPPSPASQPLVVGDTIVFRGADRMFGVSAETGLREWAWPPQLAWNGRPNVVNTQAEKVRLQQRMVRDSIYGRASSDGKLIFFVPNPGRFNSRENRNVFQNANLSNPEDLRTCNELIAIDAESSGMLRWRVGGPNGFDEPRLSNAFFMGEPLPLEGVLYCCCMLDNAIQIVALDSITGKLRWSQAIAAHDGSGFTSNSMRRFSGVTPSYADGKLVCLTGTGGVVAIEVSTRSLLWGYEYRLPGNTQVVSDTDNKVNVLTDAWRDSQVTILNGKVFLTPVLSRELICLELDEGYGVWFEENGFLPKRVNRDDSLYLAGINRDQLILVGPRKVRAIDSLTGNNTWEVALAIDDLPSGRGYIGDDSLFVPTTSRKVLRIDLVEGKIVESVGTSRVLGNLSRVKGDVVSHGVDHVASFPEYDASKKKIGDLAFAELNEEQQFIALQAMIQQGDLEDGVDLLISLAEENSRPRYSALLKSCVNNFRNDNPALSLKALDSLKRLYPDLDLEDLERLRMLSKLRTGEFRESLQLGLDQLEEQFAKFRNGDISDQSDKIVKGINATLLDRRSSEPVDPPVIEGVDEVEFDNRYDKLLYSEFGWQRARLQLAIEGLEEQDPGALVAFKSRTAKFVLESTQLSREKFQWLMDRLPENAIDTTTLMVISKYYLEHGEYLAALMYANAGINRGGVEVEQFKLLKIEILFAGRDFRAAKTAIDGIESENLNDDAVALMDKLKQGISDAMQRSSSNVLSATNWFSNDSLNVESGVAIRSSKRRQKRTKYRIPFEFGGEVDPVYRSLRLFACPWGDRESEIELRNNRGNLVREVQIRKSDDNKSFGYTRRCYVDIQNHIAELKVSKATYYVDWFKILAGKDSSLWKLPISQMSRHRTAFSGGRETVVGNGNWLFCYETLTGKLVWKRKMKHRLTRVVSHGSFLTSWSEAGRQFNTLEAATGRLVKTANSSRYVVSRTLGDQFVLEYPIRKGELSPQREKELTSPDKPESPAQIAKRFAVFNAAEGRIVWESIFHPKSFIYYRGFEIAVLDHDGRLRFLNLKDGQVTAEVTLPMSEVEKRSLKAFNLQRHSAGWVVHVRGASRKRAYFSRGNASYQYNELYRNLGSGSVYLLDDSRKNLVWDSPVYLEQMEYLESQPFDSPVLMFGRHVERTIADKGESHHMQTVCLDRSTGNVVSNDIVKTLESYYGHAIAWEQSKPGGAFDTLVISTAVEIQKIRFGSDDELPPLPETHLTFNAMDFFEDPIFEETKGEVVDFRVEEFRQRAFEADKVRTEKLPEAIEELKSRMKFGSESQVD